jgi:putative transposase
MGEKPSPSCEDFSRLARQFWGRHLWAGGYFAASSGNVTDEVFEYIEMQDKIERGRDDGFSIGDHA